MRIFVECEAGSRLKRRWDEERFVPRDSAELLLPYPYAYGFVPGTAGGEEGDCLDAYLVTEKAYPAGVPVEAELRGVLEFFEGGERDYKLVCVPADERGDLPPDLRERLEAFLLGIFKAFPDLEVSVGALKGRAEAEALLASRLGASRP